MNEINGQMDLPREGIRQRRKKNSWLKFVITAIIGGVIGSILTMSVLPQSDYFTKQVAKQVVVLEEEDEPSERVRVQKSPAGTEIASVADTVEEASKGIVGIVNFKAATQWRFPGFEQGRGSNVIESGTGSGVIFKIDKEHAFIVTNNHVIEGAEEIEITVHGGKKTKAEVIGADALTDLAVLKIEAKYAASANALDFGDSSQIRAGDPVLAIGNPLGLELSNTVTQGIISAVDRTVTVPTSAGNWDLNVLQTDAAINPGNSGGALINLSGQVIGINSLKISSDKVEGLGFAIPSNDVVDIINEIMEKGEVERPYIGVGLSDLKQLPQRYLEQLPQNLDGGAIIVSVDPNSAAAKAGLQVEDIITAIDGQIINNSDELRKYLYTELEAGEKATLEIYRGHEKLTIELTLTSKGRTIE